MTAPRMADTRRCPFCEQWVPMPARFAHKAFNAHKAHCITSHECTTECSTPASTATVKRADLFGNVIDTHQTEAELNGFRPTQGALL